jgi:hypothetical protein
VQEAVNQKFGLMAPEVCGEVPEKSTATRSSSTVSLTWILTGGPPAPSSSIQSVNSAVPEGSSAMAARVSASV